MRDQTASCLQPYRLFSNLVSIYQKLHKGRTPRSLQRSSRRYRIARGSDGPRIRSLRGAPVHIVVLVSSNGHLKARQAHERTFASHGTSTLGSVFVTSSSTALNSLRYAERLRCLALTRGRGVACEGCRQRRCWAASISRCGRVLKAKPKQGEQSEHSSPNSTPRASNVSTAHEDHQELCERSSPGSPELNYIVRSQPPLVEFVFTIAIHCGATSLD